MTEREPGVTPLPRWLGVRVGMLIAFTLMVAVAFVGYVLYARGVFETTQRLTLITDNAEGVGIGMDLTFSGFPVGTVRRISLGEGGEVRIDIAVPQKDARWLRASSVFTIERGLVGGAKLRAFSGDLADPPLEDGAVRAALRGDTTEEIPRMVAMMRTILEHIESLTGPGGGVQANLANLRVLTGRMAGRYGVLGGMLGSDDDARKVIASIERANALLDALKGVSARLDGLVAKTDQRLLGEGGLLAETQRAAAQASAILGDVRESLKTVDAILASAQATAGNVKTATTDLHALRSEVEASLRKVTSLIDEINRKWPFERKTEIRLP